jgi:hypothetical protein
MGELKPENSRKLCHKRKRIGHGIIRMEENGQ